MLIVKNHFQCNSKLDDTYTIPTEITKLSED